MWKEGQLTVADPTQELTSLALTVGGKRLTIDLPQGEMAGQSVSRVMK